MWLPPVSRRMRSSIPRSVTWAHSKRARGFCHSCSTKLMTASTDLVLELQNILLPVAQTHHQATAPPAPQPAPRVYGTCIAADCNRTEQLHSEKGPGRDGGA